MEADDLPKSNWLLKASAGSTAEHHTTHATHECNWEWPRSDLQLVYTSLPHWLENSSVCVAFFCLQTAGLTWSSEAEKQMWRSVTTAHSPSCTSSPSVPSDSSWLLITWGLEMVYKKLESFFLFQKVANFILFQTNLSSFKFYPFSNKLSTYPFLIISSPKSGCCL